MTRRFFNACLALLMLAFGCSAAETAPAIPAADLVLVGGVVYAAGKSRPGQAVAVREGQIVFVGSAEDVEGFISEETEVIELGRQMLLPGFVDVHNHVFEGASDAGGTCLLPDNASLEELIPPLEQCAAQVGDPGEWVIGHGHQLQALLADDPSTDPRGLLDELFPEHPVVIMEESSHSMLVNSLALELAGMDEESPHPPGGRLMRHPDTGRLNGVLFDNAGDIVMELAWNSLKNRDRDSYRGLLAGMELMAANGITTVGDGRLYWRRGWYEVWQRAHAEGELIVRVSLRPWIYPEVDPAAQLAFLKRVQSADTSKRLTVDQVKMYSDGVMHFGTAKMLDRYKSTWHADAPHGINYIPPERMKEWLSRLAAIGYGAHIHAVGDGGVREALDAIESARAAGSERLYTLTHLELVDRADFGRFKRLDVDADFQAGASFFQENREAVRYVGRKKNRVMTPMRELYDAGARITFSSDWTVNPLNPLVAIANSVRLKRSKGLPDVHAALAAATLNGARALGLGSVTGSIEVGKSADFAVLERDITKLSADEIEETAITMTILQGDIVFDAAE